MARLQDDGERRRGALPPHQRPGHRLDGRAAERRGRGRRAGLPRRRLPARGWSASPSWSASSRGPRCCARRCGSPSEHLVMRNLAETVHIRLAAVEELAVRQVLAVRAGDRRLRQHGAGPHVAQVDACPAGAPSATPSPRPARTRGCATPTSPSTGSTSSSTPPAPRRGHRRLGGAAALPDAVRREPALAAPGADRGRRRAAGGQLLPLISSGTRCSRPSSTSASPWSNSSP